jgi:hypothetical protein
MYTSCIFKVVRVIFGTKENLYYLEDQLLRSNMFIEGKKYKYQRGAGGGGRQHNKKEIFNRNVKGKHQLDPKESTLYIHFI